MHRTIRLAGRVRSGAGEAAAFTELPWVRDAFRARLGFAPYPGTLNLAMNGAGWVAARGQLQAASGIPIVPSTGFCAARCFPVMVAGHIRGAVVLPEVADYPDDQLEVLAPLGLRDVLGVRDGDQIFLTLTGVTP